MNMLAEMLETSHKGKKKMMTDKLRVNNRIYKWILFAFLAESWVISMRGCAWNDSIIVYLMAAVIAAVVWSMELEKKISAGRMFKAAAVGSVAVCLFLTGALWGNISGNIILSRLGFKTLIVFLGNVFLYLVFCSVKKPEIKAREVLVFVGAAPVLVFSLWGQGVFSWKSLAGWGMPVWGFLFWIISREVEECRRVKVSRGCLAFLFAAFTVLGEWGNLGARFQTDSFILVSGVSGYLIVIWSILFYIALKALTLLMKKVRFSEDEESCRNAEKSGRIWAGYALSIFIMWIPYYLCWYPGILSHDSEIQMEQALGLTAYSNHHPWIHTMLIKLCVMIGSLFGDINTGVGFYTLCSMLIMAGVFGMALLRLRQKGASRGVLTALWFFFAVLPINAVFSVTMWKDVMFGAAVLTFLLMMDWMREKYRNHEKIPACYLAAMVLVSICVCLFRSNGMYAWIFMLPFWLISAWKARKTLNRDDTSEKRTYFWQASGITVTVLAVCMLYKNLFLPALNVTEPDLIESLSIPAQQIACVLANGGDVAEEDLALLEQVIDTERVKTDYTFYISDPIKNLVRVRGNQEYIRENIVDFAVCYIRTGLKNPYLFVKGYVEQTKGYWYHKVNNWIYYVEGVHSNQMGISRASLLPEKLVYAVEKILEKTEDYYFKFFSIALSTWMVLFGAVQACNKKRNMLGYLLLAGIILTLLIATPVCAEFRYAYAVFVGAPVQFLLTMCERRNPG